MAEDDIGKLKKRFCELSERAERSGVPQCTRFLNMAEQSVLLSLRLAVPPFLWGGYDGAERRMAVFAADEDEARREAEEQLCCLCISPANGRFAQELTHRDHLGSLMGLGITREVLGDIVLREGSAYLFCMESVAGFIAENLEKVRNTTVKCAPAELPEGGGAEAEERSVTVASERLDSIIAAVWKLSREEAKALCERGLVYVDSRLVTKAGSQLDEGCAVSVRGRGRFTYLGLERETKKGKLRVRVRLP